jgi:hypothetical protein
MSSCTPDSILRYLGKKQLIEQDHDNQMSMSTCPWRKKDLTLRRHNSGGGAVTNLIVQLQLREKLSGGRLHRSLRHT